MVTFLGAYYIQMMFCDYICQREFSGVPTVSGYIICPGIVTKVIAGRYNGVAILALKCLSFLVNSPWIWYNFGNFIYGTSYRYVFYLNAVYTKFWIFGIVRYFIFKVAPRRIEVRTFGGQYIFQAPVRC